jgi:intein/homing endonuclease
MTIKVLTKESLSGIKSSLMGEPEFNRIVDEKTKQWIRFGKDVIIMKTGRFLVITDAKRELVITGSSPFKVLKKLGKITGETKKQYQPMSK